MAVVLVIGRTVIPSQKEKFLTPIPHVYTFRDEYPFIINIQAIHMKAVKADKLEVEKDICNDASEEVFQGGYRAKHNEPLFQHLRNIMAKLFKSNVARSFVYYTIESYGSSRSV